MQHAALFSGVDSFCIEHGAKLIINVTVLGQSLQGLHHGFIHPLVREVHVNATGLQMHRFA